MDQYYVESRAGALGGFSRSVAKGLSAAQPQLVGGLCLEFRVYGLWFKVQESLGSELLDPVRWEPLNPKPRRPNPQVGIGKP